MTELLTINEAAERMHVTRQTIYAWIKDGNIKPVRTPSGRLRIPVEQLIMKESNDIEKVSYHTYPILDISHVEQERIEQIGSKAKFWFYKDKTGKYLFKAGRPNTGENWAEKVACELCELLGLPHAQYEFAIYKGTKGLITPSFIPEGGWLEHGNELMANMVSEYEIFKTYHQSQHTVERVLMKIGKEDIQLPIGWKGFGNIKSALDVFVGYLMLDAWIANQDRHDLNWILVRINGEKHLAPTFDHASSLGRNESDESRQSRLYTKDKGRGMEHYVERATSAFYASETDTKPMSTLSAFIEAAKIRQNAAKSWIKRIEDVSSTKINEIFNKVPKEEITEVAIEYAQTILDLNRQRILSLEFKSK